MSRWNHKTMLLGKGRQMKQLYPQKEQKLNRDRGRKYLRLVAGIVAFSAAGLLIVSSSSSADASLRALSVASHSKFTPQLSFTGPGTFPNFHHVQANLLIDGSSIRLRLSKKVSAKNGTALKLSRPGRSLPSS